MQWIYMAANSHALAMRHAFQPVHAFKPHHVFLKLRSQRQPSSLANVVNSNRRGADTRSVAT